MSTHTAHTPHADPLAHFTHITCTHVTTHQQNSLILLEIFMAHYMVSVGKCVCMCPVSSTADQVPWLWGDPGEHWALQEGLSTPGSLLLALMSLSLTLVSVDTLRAQAPAQVMSLTPGHTCMPTGQKPCPTTQHHHALELWGPTARHTHGMSIYLRGPGNYCPRTLP